MTLQARGELDAERGRVLVALARSAIVSELGGETEALRVSSAGWLEEPAATFVTLEIAGRLRGCIGSLNARRALRDDVMANARAAAFKDPRFPPLTAKELDGLSVEVSVLSKPEPIECRSEAELCEVLRPGIDGVVLDYRLHRATFLPQVWEELPQPNGFLASLKRKARLERDFWSDEMRFSRYTVEKYGEE